MILKVLAGSTILVLAFSAGIGLTIFQRATVFGAPTPPLTSVAHDVTLNGTGTASSPLGVSTSGIGTGQLANGAATLAKLGIAGSAAIGSSVGYNGSGLAWQAATSGGGVRVVDAVGHSFPLVPAISGPFSALLWQINGVTVAIPISINGVATDLLGINLVVYYTSVDCSGPTYFYNNAFDATNQLIQSPLVSTFVSGTTLHYAGPVQQVGVNSISYSNGSSCTAVAFGTLSANPVVTADLSSAFVPPFHVQLN